MCPRSPASKATRKKSKIKTKAKNKVSKALKAKAKTAKTITSKAKTTKKKAQCKSSATSKKRKPPLSKSKSKSTPKATFAKKVPKALQPKNNRNAKAQRTKRTIPSPAEAFPELYSKLSPPTVRHNGNGRAENDKWLTKDDPALDRRIIEGMLNDREGLLDDFAKEGIRPSLVMRRAAELGLSEAYIRQVQGVAADLAGERPGGKKTPPALGARTCLCCDRIFLSSGPGNRLCMRCRGGDAGLAQL